MAEDYQFDDVGAEPDSNEVVTEVTTDATTDTSTASDSGSRSTGSGSSGNGNNGYASELFSKQIKAKFRTFFIDLKESANGKFVKISEKSHGRKSTIMMDAEDIPVFIEALEEIKAQL